MSNSTVVIYSFVVTFIVMADKSINLLFGERLRSLRMAKGLTPEQFYDLTGIDPDTLQRYEEGRLEAMLETMQVIANALEVNLKELLTFDE